jgi:hypothetical protein
MFVGIIPRVFLPMSGINPNNNWIKKMTSESSFYSKGRGDKAKTFSGSKFIILFYFDSVL